MDRHCCPAKQGCRSPARAAFGDGDSAGAFAGSAGGQPGMQESRWVVPVQWRGWGVLCTWRGGRLCVTARADDLCAAPKISPGPSRAGAGGLPRAVGRAARSSVVALGRLVCRLLIGELPGRHERAFFGARSCMLTQAEVVPYLLRHDLVCPRTVVGATCRCSTPRAATPTTRSSARAARRTW